MTNKEIYEYVDSSTLNISANFHFLLHDKESLAVYFSEEYVKAVASYFLENGYDFTYTNEAQVSRLQLLNGVVIYSYPSLIGPEMNIRTVKAQNIESDKE